MHILVNNAGAAWGADFDNFPENGWDKVMDTNVKSMFFLTRDLTPALAKNASDDEPSRVINIGSIDGINVPIFETFSYSASKAALIQMTKTTAVIEAKKNIDNLYAMQNFAMQEIWKVLEINKNKNN